MAGKLTVLEAKALVKPGRYVDGDGLHLHVRTAERRAWVFRYTRLGKTRDLGLGAFPETTLAAARTAAAQARARLRDGLEPLSKRSEAVTSATHTFKAVAEDFIATHRQGWRNSKHAAQWDSTLATYAYPVIGSLPVQAVTMELVLTILRPVWSRAPETASRLRGRIEVILDAAKARGWRTGENPARWKGNLSGLLPAKERVSRVEHQPALPWQQMGAFLGELRHRDGVAARALELAILTAARTGEVRGARWKEVDLEAAVWVIPAERMKGGRLHRVPLSVPAVALLRALLPLRTGPTALVFPGIKSGQPLSDMTLSALLRRMNGEGEPRWRDITGRAIVPHGFRSTFRVWAGEQTTHPREVVEAALAHVMRDKVEAAYARTDLLERRRPLMEEWGKWCTSPVPT